MALGVFDGKPLSLAPDDIDALAAFARDVAVEIDQQFGSPRDPAEPSVGVTAYLNEKKAYHVSTLMSITAQSKKEDSDTKVGTTLTLEGGLGGDFLKGGLTAGLAYYASFKLAEDQIDGVPGILIRGKNKSFALGPEVSLALARGDKLYGFVKANYQWETYARTNTQGGEFLLAVSFLVKPIKLPGK